MFLAEGYETLTTALYFKGDPYLNRSVSASDSRAPFRPFHALLTAVTAARLAIVPLSTPAPPLTATPSLASRPPSLSTPSS